jgi:Secretion system C-terminal sorting domain
LNITAAEPVLGFAIFDVEGRILSSGNGDFSTIDVTNLENGIYFLKIQTEKGIGMNKFIKE